MRRDLDRRITMPGILALGLLVAVGSAVAGELEPRTVRINVFPGLQNLPIFAAQQQGFFAKRGLKIDVQLTPNSQEQRDGLAQGRFEIAHAAVDNAVAMVELAKADAAIVLGGDSGLNSLIVQPEIRSYADIRGKTVIVDAPNTAYALLLYKALKLNGLQRGADYTVKAVGGTGLRLEAMRKDRSYVASMMNPPFSVTAEREGLRNMGLATKLVGPYQGPGAFVMRPWARANADTLVHYIQAYVEAMRWVLNPANKDRAVALLAERLKLTPDVAAKTYEVATDPAGGFAKDARLDVEGFKSTLKLRAEIEGQWGGTPPPPEKYIDLSYFERALAGL